MKKVKQPLSIRIIYWFTQITFWLYVLVFVAAIAFNIALQAEVLGDSLQIHVGLPVNVNYTEAGLLKIGNISQEVEFVEAIGKLHLLHTNPKLAKWFGAAIMCVLIIFMYIFIMFRRFIGNVHRGFVFERFNIRMLKNIAYGLVVLWFFSIIYSALFYYFIAKELVFEHLEISSKYDSFGILLVIALFLWMLSHIFMNGVRLQEDQKLTV